MNRQTRPWTKEEESILQERYLVEGPTILSEELGRTKQSVQRKAYYLGLTHREKGQRTLVEIAQLRKIHEEEKHKSRMKSPEYHEKRKGIVLAYNTRRRAQRRESGICIRCNNPVLEHSTSYCLIHWTSVVMGNTCKQYNGDFGKILLEKLEQQDYRCALTGDLLIPGLNCSVDHIVPKAKGGAVDDPDNLRWVTVDANRAKGFMSDNEFVEFCKRVIAHHQRSHVQTYE